MGNLRQQAINTTIQSKGEVKLAELEKMFPEVSSMTLRRDLEALEQRGEIVRIRGGAKSLAMLSMLKEAAYTQRVSENINNKMLIAEKALPFVSSGRAIYIDSGTTCMCFAQKLPDENLVVLTSAPNIALELIRNQNIRVNLTGGLLNRDTLTLSGINAAEYIKSINIDVAFMGASAFSLKSGFTCGDFNEMELKRLIIKRAHQVIILMDTSKLDYSMPYTFATLKDIDVYIPDQLLTEEYQKALRRAHIKVV